MKQLKSELATLDRKIASELAPKNDENDGEEIMRDEPHQQSKVVDVSTPTANSKKPIVVEPATKYRGVAFGL